MTKLYLSKEDEDRRLPADEFQSELRQMKALVKSGICDSTVLADRMAVSVERVRKMWRLIK